MVIDDIKSGIIQALKSKDTVRTETLRFLLSEVRYMAIAKYGADWETKISDTDTRSVIRLQVKRHRESVDTFEKNHRSDLADREKSQLVILESMVPAQMSDDELNQIAGKAVSGGEVNFGLLMKQVMAQVGDKADGARVSAAIRKLLDAKA